MMRPIGGAVADRIGGVRALTFLYIITAIALAAVSFRPAQSWSALALFVVGMLALGPGNGAVFQLVPQRFRREIGVMTGLVGMTGGIGGFYLASSLGFSKQLTGSYQAGLLVFALLAVLAVVGPHLGQVTLADHLGCHARRRADLRRGWTSIPAEQVLTRTVPIAPCNAA